MELYQQNINYLEVQQNISINHFANLYKSELINEWNSISWNQVINNIFELQRRIFNSIKNNLDYNEVKKLEEILLKIDSVLLYSIKENFYDQNNQITLQSNECMALFHKIKHMDIAEYNNILDDTSVCKIIQSILQIALKPRFEAIFEHSSYGSRFLRGNINALAYMYKQLYEYPWVFKSEFNIHEDNLTHKLIIEKLDNSISKDLVLFWLNSYYLYNKTEIFKNINDNESFPNLLLNILLHGMEQVFNVEYGEEYCNNKNKYVLIRYNNEFIILSKTKKDIEQIPILLSKYLKERKIELKADKTTITHVNQGFNFLEFNIKCFDKKNNKIRIKPSKKAVKELKFKLKEVYKKNIGNNVTGLIMEWNMLIDEKTSYWCYFSSKKVFNEIDYYLKFLTIRFLKKLHSNKSWTWIKHKYFKKDIKNKNHTAYILTDPKNNLLQLQKMSWIKSKQAKSFKKNYSIRNKKK